MYTLKLRKFCVQNTMMGTKLIGFRISNYMAPQSMWQFYYQNQIFYCLLKLPGISIPCLTFDGKVDTVVFLL